MLLTAPLSKTPQDEKRLLIEGGQREQRLPFWTTLPAKLAPLFITIAIICFLYLRAPVWGEDDPEAEVILYRPGNATVETPSGEQPPHPLDFQPNNPDVVKYLKNDLVRGSCFYENPFAATREQLSNIFANKAKKIQNYVLVLVQNPLARLRLILSGDISKGYRCNIAYQCYRCYRPSLLMQYPLKMLLSVS